MAPPLARTKKSGGRRQRLGCNLGANSREHRSFKKYYCHNYTYKSSPLLQSQKVNAEPPPSPKPSSYTSLGSTLQTTTLPLFRSSNRCAPSTTAPPLPTSMVLTLRLEGSHDATTATWGRSAEPTRVVERLCLNLVSWNTMTARAREGESQRERRPKRERKTSAPSPARGSSTSFSTLGLPLAVPSTANTLAP